MKQLTLRPGSALTQELLADLGRAVDLTGVACFSCGRGEYRENPFGGRPDDWDGVLHCDNRPCQNQVMRWQPRELFVAPIPHSDYPRG